MYENPMHKVEVPMPSTYQPDISIEFGNFVRFIELKGGYLRSESARKLANVQQYRDILYPVPIELVVITNNPGRVQHRKSTVVDWCKRHVIPCYIMDGYLGEELFHSETLPPCAWEK